MHLFSSSSTCYFIHNSLLWLMTYYLPSITFFSPPKIYFLGFSISKGKEMLPSQKLLSLVCWVVGPKQAIMEILQNKWNASNFIWYMDWFEGFLRGGCEGQEKVAFPTIEKRFLYLVCYITHLWESQNQAFSILDGSSCALMSLSPAKMEARIFNTFLG